MKCKMHEMLYTETCINFFYFAFKILFKIMSIIFICALLVILICDDVINLFFPHLFEQWPSVVISKAKLLLLQSACYLTFCYTFCTWSGSIWEMKNNRIAILLLKWLLIVCQSECHICSIDICTVWTTEIIKFKIHFLFIQGKQHAEHMLVNDT